MARVFNFSPGPAALPEAVLRQAAEEMLDWHGTGLSVMEMSHRGKDFMGIHAQAQADLRELLGIPFNYKTLFLQGGGVGENAIVPMNLLRGKTSTDHIHTGIWTGKTIAEARKYGQVNIAASAETNGFTAIPERATWKLDPNAAYVHICANETIGGLEYHWVPDTGDVPLVADMSSTILSRPIEVAKFGAIYAGAQKNIGPSGLTLVIVREDLLGQPLPITPTAFDYSIQAKNDSMINTPPTFAIYIAGLVFQWLKAQGGLVGMAEKNRIKAELLYGTLDASGFYQTTVVAKDRSRMNVPFRLADESLNDDFLKGAKERGMVALKGHSSVGGMRASIYNAVSLEAVQALVAYMKDFEARRG
jgi:phosphoserine aminotransferase